MTIRRGHIRTDPRTGRTIHVRPHEVTGSTVAAIVDGPAAIDAAVTLRADPFAGGPVNGKWGTFAATVPDDLTAESLTIDDGDGQTLVWRGPDGGVYGRVECDGHIDGDTDRADIVTFEVHPDARRRGIAKKMLADLWHRGGGRLLASTNGFTPDGRNHLSRYVYSIPDESDGIETMIHDEGIETGSGEYWDRFDELVDDREAAMLHACEQAFGPA